MSFYYLIYFAFLCFSRLFLNSKPSFVPDIQYYLSYQRARFTWFQRNHSCGFFETKREKEFPIPTTLACFFLACLKRNHTISFASRLVSKKPLAVVSLKPSEASLSLKPSCAFVLSLKASRGFKETTAQKACESIGLGPIFSLRANQEARKAYCFALSLLSFQPKSASSFVLFYPTLVYYCTLLFLKRMQ